MGDHASLQLVREYLEKSGHHATLEALEEQLSEAKGSAPEQPSHEDLVASSPLLRGLESADNKSCLEMLVVHQMASKSKKKSESKNNSDAAEAKDEWSKQELKTLKVAVNKTKDQSDKNLRWKEVAGLVGNGRSKKECHNKYKELKAAKAKEKTEDKSAKKKEAEDDVPQKKRSDSPPRKAFGQEPQGASSRADRPFANVRSSLTIPQREPGGAWGGAAVDDLEEEDLEFADMDKQSAGRGSENKSIPKKGPSAGTWGGMGAAEEEQRQSMPKRAAAGNNAWGGMGGGDEDAEDDEDDEAGQVGRGAKSSGKSGGWASYGRDDEDEDEGIGGWGGSSKKKAGKSSSEAKGSSRNGSSSGAKRSSGPSSRGFGDDDDDDVASEAVGFGTGFKRRNPNLREAGSEEKESSFNARVEERMGFQSGRSAGGAGGFSGNNSRGKPSVTKSMESMDLMEEDDLDGDLAELDGIDVSSGGTSTSIRPRTAPSAFESGGRKGGVRASDFDDDDDDYADFGGGMSKVSSLSSTSGGLRSVGGDQEIGDAIRLLLGVQSVSGGGSSWRPSSSLYLPSSWLQQGFFFAEQTLLKYGLVQQEGGPCGVLAAVQAVVLVRLLDEGGGVEQVLSAIVFTRLLAYS
jgi:hypothetical protein